ncbi:amphi-Trp domain-containing protein [Halomicroarcula sp. GCM10025710]
MSRDDYGNELTAGREEIASILSGVAEGIRTGTVRLGDSPDAVTVETPDELTLEIELETEDDEMSLELGWSGPYRVTCLLFRPPTLLPRVRTRRPPVWEPPM